MKRNSTLLLILCVFNLFLVSVSNSQDQEFYYRTRLTVMFVPGVFQLSGGAMSASPAQVQTSPAWFSDFASSSSLQSIVKTNPAFVPGDTITTLGDGTVIKKMDFSDVYTFVFPDGRNLDSLRNYLDAQLEVIFAERWPKWELHLMPNDPFFSKQWPLENGGDHDIDATGA